MWRDEFCRENTLTPGSGFSHLKSWSIRRRSSVREPPPSEIWDPLPSHPTGFAGLRNAISIWDLLSPLPNYSYALTTSLELGLRTYRDVAFQNFLPPSSSSGERQPPNSTMVSSRDGISVHTKGEKCSLRFPWWLSGKESRNTG